MNDYFVALDADGSYERVFISHQPEGAAEEWAAWYCATSAEYELDECFVRAEGEEWQRFQITIEAVPSFHASKAT